MKNFFEINRALAAKKKFFYLALAAITLTLASCGDKGNEPEFAYFGADKFTIEFSEITSTSFKVTITPNDPEMYYDFEPLSSKDLVDKEGNPYSTVQEKYDAAECNSTAYGAYNNLYKRKGKQSRTFDNLYNIVPDTEYFVVVFQVTPEYNYKVLAYKSVKTLPQGALSGLFSVGENKQVRFSQGNLQGTIMAYPMEPKWYFATNQWDIIGNNMSVRTELFSWNTISQYSSFADWKNSSIENGNKGNTTWRLLSSEEWNYLFRTRPNAEKLFALGKVEGTNGVILLPDNWDNSIKPVNLASENGLNWVESLGEYYDFTDSYTYNSNPDYSTATQWKELADLGAVFLPAAGEEYEGKKYSVNEDGCYLTPSLYYWEGGDGPIPDAEVFYFGIGGYERMYLIPGSVDEIGLTGGASLRLVMDVK